MVILIESFDTIASSTLINRWTSIGSGASAPIVSSGNGRRSTQSLRHTIASSATVGQPVSITPATPAPSGATFVLGFAFKCTSFNGLETDTHFDPASSGSSGGQASGNFLALIRQGSTTQLAFQLNTNGTISVYRGQTSATLLGTSTEAINAGQYQYLQCKGTIHGSTGSVTITRDGTTILSLTNKNTQETASATWDELSIFRLSMETGDSVTWDLDDLYLLDGTTSADDPRSDFLGDCRVDVILPDGVGTYNDSTPSGGAVARYTMVDEAPHDANTTYNSFTTAAQKDSYTYAAAPVSGATIHAVQACATHRKEDAGTATARLLTRLSSTDYYGDSRSLGSTTYGCARQIWAQKPSDSSDWTSTDIDGAEFGYEKET